MKSPEFASKFKTQNSKFNINWDAVEQEAAQLLSRYLQFDTTNPPGNELEAINFLAEVLRDHGFVPQVFEAAPGRANLIVRLQGQGHQPPCLLYGHADVVPAEAADWSVPPFGGIIKDGFVWGRGALDNKGLGIIFLQTLILLKQYAPLLNRDIILLIAADEEVSSQYGVAWLLNHHPQLLQAEYVWDEGGMGRQVDNQNSYQIAVAEKIPLTVKLMAYGTPGHASVPRFDNPQDRLVKALYKIKKWNYEFRLTEPVIALLKTLAPGRSFLQSLLFAHAEKRLVWPLLRSELEGDPLFAPIIRNTINLTILHGGHASNVVPAQAGAKLDVRLLPDEDPNNFLIKLRSLIGDSKVSVEIEHMPPPQTPTPLDTHFYNTLAQTLRSIDPNGVVVPYLTPGATDSRFFRAAGMKAYGFMPMLLQDAELGRIHGIDERISIENLRLGIQIVFETLIKL